MKKLLKNMFVNNKRVIVRCDFNVPILNGNILDDTKIKKSLDTINYLLKENCKIILLSHLGRVKTEEDKLTNSLKPVKDMLEKYLNKPILFAKDILSEETKNMALNLKSGEILLLENTRFLDIPNKLESIRNDKVAKYIASFGEVFVFDAFAVAHRDHTTVTGIAKFLPNCLGFLAEQEINMLDKTIKNPERPFAVMMGGAKVDDKLEIIKNLLPKCDYLLLSGGIANSFLVALNLNVGASLKTNNPEIIKELKALLLKYKDKFALPLDVVTVTTYDNNPIIKATNKIEINDVIKDIGMNSIKKYKSILEKCNTIFLNGTMGIYEEKEFANGTKEILNILSEKKDKVTIGGGDTIAAINNLGFKGQFINISSGGGATLEYIAKGHLPGLDVIMEEDNIEILDL